MILAPSILSSDFARLAEEVAAAARGGATLVHVDVMDGHFVPNITLGPPIVASLHKATPLPLDVHLMIENADRYLQAFVDAGAAWISLHQEAVPHLERQVAFLRERGVSYLLAGAHDVDLTLALEKIGARFGVRTLMLEGGGKINGGFLRAGLIDEVSLLIAPVADGRIGTPTAFDVLGDDVAPHRVALEEIERRTGDVLWLRYRVVDS